MTVDVRKAFARVFKELETHGLLLVSGSEIPNVRRLVTNQVLKGSWWKDPDANSIFAVNEMLEQHPDVVITKLVSGKVTFVHRSLWPQLFAVATVREEWQLRNLSHAAIKLMKKLDKDQTIETDKLSAAGGPKPGDTVRELELRLLIHTNQIHTKTGAHAKILETWPSWAANAGFKPRAMSASSARGFFERRLRQINPESGTNCLPWLAKTR